MFGYVQVRKPELKVRDYEIYRQYYCGLCRSLRERCGWAGQFALSYDMTFLVLLLDSLYTGGVHKKCFRCGLHPVKKRTMILGGSVGYVSDMTSLLVYYHFEDDSKDGHPVRGRTGMWLFSKQMKEVAKRYPRQEKAVVDALLQLRRLEEQQCEEPIVAAGCFGRILAEILCPRQDAFEEYLRRLGMHLGQFIYLMDAYEDLEEDLKNGTYNPFRTWQKDERFEERVREMLLDEISEAAAAFELLPCEDYRDILRNILYAGVWNRYDRIQAERAGEKKR